MEKGDKVADNPGGRHDGIRQFITQTTGNRVVDSCQRRPWLRWCLSVSNRTVSLLETIPLERYPGGRKGQRLAAPDRIPEPSDIDFGSWML